MMHERNDLDIQAIATGGGRERIELDREATRRLRPRDDDLVLVRQLQ